LNRKDLQLKYSRIKELQGNIAAQGSNAAHGLIVERLSRGRQGYMSHDAVEITLKFDHGDTQPRSGLL